MKKFETFEFILQIFSDHFLESIRIAKSQQVPLQSYLQTSNQSNTPDRANKENWQTLRQKKDQKGKILDLQSALQGELQKRMGVEEEVMRKNRQIEELEQDLVETRLKLQEMEQASYHQVKLYYKQMLIILISKKSLCAYSFTKILHLKKLSIEF